MTKTTAALACMFSLFAFADASGLLRVGSAEKGNNHQRALPVENDFQA